MPPKHDVTAKYDNDAIHIDHSVCIGCNMCVRACEYGIYSQNEKRFWPPHVNEFDLCVGCGQCVTVCPVKAIVAQP